MPSSRISPQHGASALRWGVFGTIWDIGEAAGPMIAGFLIGGLGYASTFDVIAGVTAVVTVGLMVLVRDPKTAAAHREPGRPVR